ncbi:MAG: beta-N-acetylhexosaminidase [Lachnospiraceae bacterium]|nr:beta-N-acetylhexosaminidase [Lachnospiraceae bacterium]
MKDEKRSREKRRHRRVRNQIFAYLILVVMIGLIVAAGYFGVKGIIHYVKNYNEKVNRVIEEAESSAAAELEKEGSDMPIIQEESMPVADNEGYLPDSVEDPLDELIESLLNDMSTEDMVAGMFMVTPESITGVGTVIKAGDSTKTAITEKPVGGIVYSAKNFQSAEQFTEMMTNTKGFSKYPIFAAVKAECGENPGYGIDATAKASELTDEDSVRQAYGGIASKLADYGMNMNLAPVSETVSEDGDASLQGRTFGSDAAVAAPLVNAAVQSMQEAGVSAVLQKFPGTSAEAKTLEELKNGEFVIYDMAIKGGVDCIMVSHTKVNGVTGDDTPASLSAVMIQDVLRNTLGFNGVVITDALSDSAVTRSYSPAEAAVAAVQAGADMLLDPADYQQAYDGILQAVADGTITQERIHESLYRIYRVKYKNALQ